MLAPVRWVGSGLSRVCSGQPPTCNWELRAVSPDCDQAPYHSNYRGSLSPSLLSSSLRQSGPVPEALSQREMSRETRKWLEKLVSFNEGLLRGLNANDVLTYIWKSKDTSLSQPTNHISLAALIVGIVVRVPPLSSLAAGHRQLVSSRLSAKIRVVRNVERVFQAAINWLTGVIMDQ